MGRELFGTDGVRGIAGEYPLDSDGARRIGMAVGAHFAKPGQQVVIGCDTRESSSDIVASLTAGLTAAGVNVVSVGVITTPGLAYLTREGSEFVAGVMVTASHNPYQFNGIKVFDAEGNKLSDEIEAILNKLIVDGVTEQGNGQATENESLVSGYEDFLVNSAGGLSLNGMPLAVDTANGAACGLADRVFRRLGANVKALFDKPDGRNINDGCGATDTKVLQQAVLDENLKLGVALDGDADRLIMVDEHGREVKGDYVMYILAVANGSKGVVATIMSNMGFEQALDRQGIKLVRTAVGDRYVLEGLQQTAYKLGGEQSGHIIMPELLKTGDGLLAAVQVLKALNQSDKSLGQWCDEVTLLPQAMVNVELADKTALERPQVQAFINEQGEALAGSGRLLIRPSGTEPLVRVMVEAPEADQAANQIAVKLKELINE
jgi:phosphoglucosamine mutase